MVVTNTDARNSLGFNQQTYQRLKAALELNLRRQIFVAVCDDLALRNLLAARLHAELAYPSQGAETPPPGETRYPQLVSLNLNLNDPDPVVQSTQWLAQHPLPKRKNTKWAEPLRLPNFQVLGVERLTRQPSTVQRLFLSNLQRIEHTLPTLEASLVLWMPRPWCRMIQQSAPEFWRWHTGVFEFEGDPTPTGSEKAPTTHANNAAAANTATPPKSAPTQRPIAAPPSSKTSDRPTAVPQKAASQPPSAPVAGSPVATGNATNGRQAAPPATAAADSTTETPQQNLWDILTQDLSRLDTGATGTVPAGEEKSAEPPTVSQPQPSAQSTSTTGTVQPPPNPPEAQAPRSQTPPTAATNPASTSTETPTKARRLVAGKTAAGKQAKATMPAVTKAVNPVPVTQSRSALELADFVLASITQEMGEPSAQKGTGTPLSVKVTSLSGASSPNLHPMQVLEHIEQLHLQQAPAAALAAAYRTLGNLYRDRIEQGHASQQNLLISVRSYEQALSWLDESSSLWSDILNDVGNLYWMLSHATSGEQALDYLGQSIQAYQTALSKTNPETRAHSYSMIQNNLGSAYGDLARYQDPVKNLQYSIVAYQEALRYRDTKADPQRFAATQNNLGTGYWNLAQHEKPIINLSQAIVAYNAALQHYDPDQEPLNYAMIQNNLGTAYWNLAQFEQNDLDQSLGSSLNASPEDFLQLAIGAYRVALVYRTQDTVPAAYAATQNNLGTAYWHLANQPTLHYDDRRECLQQAIEAYNVALNAADRLLTQSMPLSFDYYATHNNLGLAIHQLATDKHCSWDKTTQIAYLEASLDHHLQALQGWQSKPDFYQTALGYVVQTVRTFYSEHGIDGQNLALSKIPGQLLPEILKKL